MTFQRGNRKASKLTGEQAIEIRERYAMPGVTQTQLAQDYGVSVNTIRSVINYTSWRDMAGGNTPINRPPPHAQPPAMLSETELAEQAARLAATMNVESTGLAKLNKLSQPTALEKSVGEGLDKLEKGD